MAPPRNWDQFRVLKVADTKWSPAERRFEAIATRLYTFLPICSALDQLVMPFPVFGRCVGANGEPPRRIATIAREDSKHVERRDILVKAQ